MKPFPCSTSYRALGPQPGCSFCCFLLEVSARGVSWSCMWGWVGASGVIAVAWSETVVAKFTPALLSSCYISIVRGGKRRTSFLALPSARPWFPSLSSCCLCYAQTRSIWFSYSVSEQWPLCIFSATISRIWMWEDQYPISVLIWLQSRACKLLDTNWCICTS